MQRHKTKTTDWADKQVELSNGASRQAEWHGTTVQRIKWPKCFVVLLEPELTREVAQEKEVALRSLFWRGRVASFDEKHS